MKNAGVTCLPRGASLGFVHFVKSASRIADADMKAECGVGCYDLPGLWFLSDDCAWGSGAVPAGKRKWRSKVSGGNFDSGGFDVKANELRHDSVFRPLRSGNYEDRGAGYGQSCRQNDKYDK
jgi:hypothetical protein